MSEKQGWIGVDLDGTIAHYDGWKGERHIGKPVIPMLERVQMWLSEGKVVKIFTARVSVPEDEGLAEVTKAIQDWCEEHVGQRLEVTCRKDYQMIELWDDRARQVRTNTGYPVGA